MPFWKKTPQQPGPDTGAGSPAINGDLRVPGGRKATVLRAKQIGLAVLGAGLLIAAIFYLVITHVWTGSSASSSDDAPGKAPAIGVPPVTKHVPSDQRMSAPPSSDNSSSTTQEANQPSTKTPPASSTSAPSRQKSPQIKAFDSALSGGSAVISWSSNKSSGQREQQGSTEPVAIQSATSKKQKAQVSVYSSHLVRQEVSPYELLQGTVIPAVLETGIKSDIPGEVTAVVRNPVYNSVSGASVLVPAGSKLVGTYGSHVIAGDTRVAVDWTRIEFPNGTYINLGSGMPGASSTGYSGFHDLVNNHTWSIFRSALLLSLIDVGMAVSSPQQTTSTNGVVSGNVALADGEEGLAQTFGEAEAQLLQREINIAPTLTIPTGYPWRFQF